MQPLTVADVARAAEVHWKWGTTVGSPWEEFRGRFFALPDWFDWSLDPLSQGYASQQEELWRLISGRTGSYVPVVDEQAPDVSQMDAIVRPGFYSASSDVAGDHLIALGQLVKLSGISAGDRVLEYGAGFGQIALTFARLGAVVDTVDINPHFCRAIKAQAELFNVPLTPFQTQFGVNPRPGLRYKLIVFYESFHHCRHFLDLIVQLRDLIAADGKILLGGEPIEPSHTPQIPFPWGIRLDAENVAVVRKRGWFEIGFQEDFLLRCFTTRGFMYRKHPGLISRYATTYEFQPKPAVVDLATWPLLPSDEVTWHSADRGGRWTTSRSVMTLDGSDPSARIGIRVSNYHDRMREIRFSCGNFQKVDCLVQHETKEVIIERDRRDDPLVIECEALCPRIYGMPDDRKLGIFVERLRYL